MHDLWMRRAAERREPPRRVLDQALDRDGVIHELVDERGVGAVLQQAAHQVGQKVVVAADRRIDPARDGIVGPDQRAVERLRHAVQALELEIAPRAGQLDDAGDGMRVVGRELRVEGIAAVQQPARAGEIGDVGRELAGQHRVGQALLLGALDLGIPIGALDQAHRDPPAVPARKLAAARRRRGSRASDRPAPRARARPSRRNPASASRRSNRSSDGSSRSASSASMVTAMLPARARPARSTRRGSSSSGRRRCCASS